MRALGMNSTRISVALATFNGEANLSSQLDSIVSQALLPMELVVCDDGSTDNTINILEEFRERAPFPVRIHQNNANLGVTENFILAASLCSADYVAFCDQDDLWLNKKILVCDSAAEAHRPSLILHSCDEFRVEAGRMIHTLTRRLPRSVLIDGHLANPSTIWLGMSMVVRRKMLEGIARYQAAWRPYRDAIRETRPELIQIHWAECHDLLVYLMAISQGTIFLIPRFS
jgi:glycosyltransferase involved in cell wall biosynthesis